MHLIGRWERVRPLSPNAGWGRPYLLDQKWGRVIPGPYGVPERGPDGSHVWGDWVKTRDGVWLPALSGGSFNGTLESPTLFFGPGYYNPGDPVANTVALNNAYTYNTAGNGIAMPVMLTAAKTLAKVYFFITAVAGTAANVTSINLEVRNNASYLPGATLHTSAVKDPNGDAAFLGWHALDPADFALSAQTYYWIICADANGGAVDFATVLSAFGWTTVPAAPLRRHNQPIKTTNGFIGITGDIGHSGLILEFSDASIYGYSITAVANASSNTNRKGWDLAAGFTEQIKVFAAAMPDSDTNISGFEIVANDTVPGGATVASSTSLLMNPSNQAVGAMLAGSYTVPKATPERFVFTFSAAGTKPQKLSIGTANGNSTVLRQAKQGGSNSYYAEANGTTNWANDDLDALPAMVLLVEDQVAVAAGGAAANVIGFGMMG